MENCSLENEEGKTYAHTNGQEQSMLQNSDEPVHRQDLSETLDIWGKFSHPYIFYEMNIISKDNLNYVSYWKTNASAKDVQALLSSEELHRVVSSTGNVITTATKHAPGLALNVMLMPIKVPMRLLGTIWDVTTSQVNSGILTLHEHFSHTEDLYTVSNNENIKSSNSSHNKLFDVAGSMVPVIQAVVMYAADEIGSTVSNLLGIRLLPNDFCSTVDRVVESDVSNLTCTSETSSSSDEDDSYSGDQERYSSVNGENIFVIRISDLCVFQSKTYTSDYITLNSSSNNDQGVLIEELFTSMTECAFQLTDDSICFDSVDTGKRTNKRPLIHWKGVGSTEKLIRKNEGNWAFPNVLSQMETEVLLWTGRIQNTSIKSYARDIPLFKARGIIPNRNPAQLMELLYDSAQCQRYNKYSNGRKDICILQSDSRKMCKIVENETKIPFSGKVIQMKMLMLVKPITEGGYIILSRSVHNGRSTNLKPGKQNEIIWSVNILRCISDPLKTDLTVMTQANSSLIPMFFAEKVSMN